MTIWIRGGRVIDSQKDALLHRDLLVEKGIIAKILPPHTFRGGAGVRILDAVGKTVVPGLIDMHVHLREPGQEHKETVASGAGAGVAGGFVGLACMPNTDPVNDNGAVTSFIMKRGREAASARVYPIAAITRGQEGGELTDFGELKRAGAVGVSDDGFPVRDSRLMRRAIEDAAANGLVIVSHCEDRSLAAGGVMHEGSVSARLGYQGIPGESEEIMVFREIALSKLTGLPVHIAHVSTAGSVELIRRAKQEGVAVTAETAPHYFTLDHRAVETYGANAKMNPPLRSPEDVDAIRRGLMEDVIDVIATDHAPHSLQEKGGAFQKAAFGIIGLETAVPLTLALVREGVLTLGRALAKLSGRPAEILGIETGVIREGGRADLAIIDTELDFVLREEDIRSKSKNSPFIGKRMRGKNLLTLIEGRIVWRSELQDSCC